MIPSGFYIVDASVKYMNATNVLEESMVYSGASALEWSRKWQFAHNFVTVDAAISKARILREFAPVKVLQLQQDGNNSIRIGEVIF